MLFPMLRRLFDIRLHMEVRRRGFLQGGGEVSVRAESPWPLAAMQLLEPGEIVAGKGRAYRSAGVPKAVLPRMLEGEMKRRPGGAAVVLKEQLPHVEVEWDCQEQGSSIDASPLSMTRNINEMQLKYNSHPFTYQIYKIHLLNGTSILPKSPLPTMVCYLPFHSHLQPGPRETPQASAHGFIPLHTIAYHCCKSNLAFSMADKIKSMGMIQIAAFGTCLVYDLKKNHDLCSLLGVPQRQ